MLRHATHNVVHQNRYALGAHSDPAATLAAASPCVQEHPQDMVVAATVTVMRMIPVQILVLILMKINMCHSDEEYCTDNNCSE